MSIKEYYAEFEKKLIGDGHTLKKKKKKEWENIEIKIEIERWIVVIEGAWSFDGPAKKRWENDKLIYHGGRPYCKDEDRKVKTTSANSIASSSTLISNIHHSFSIFLFFPFFLFYKKRTCRVIKFPC